MPRGVYPHVHVNNKGLEIGRNDPRVRAKAVESLRRSGSTPEFREKMSKIVREQITPERKALLSKLAKTRGNKNFKGGNGQAPVRMEKMFAKFLAPAGFVHNFVVKTKGHETVHNPPDNYKVDLAQPSLKIALEVDGPAHKKRSLLDRKKTEVLEALGWEVLRLVHK